MQKKKACCGPDIEPPCTAVGGPPKLLHALASHRTVSTAKEKYGKHISADRHQDSPGHDIYTCRSVIELHKIAEHCLQWLDTWRYGFAAEKHKRPSRKFASLPARHTCTVH